MYNQKAEEEAEAEDFLEEIIAERTKKNPYFPEMLEAEMRKSQLLETLAAKRVELGLSRAKVAKRLGISTYALESLERGESNPQLAIVLHLAYIVGQTLEVRPAPLAEAAPSAV